MLLAQDGFFHWNHHGDPRATLVYVERAAHIAETGELPQLIHQTYGLPAVMAPVLKMFPDGYLPVIYGFWVLLDAAVLLVLGQLLLRYPFGSSKWRLLVVAVFLVVQPFTAVAVFWVMTEPISTALTVCAAWFVARWMTSQSLWQLALASLALGAVSVVRPEMLAFALAFLVGVGLLRALVTLRFPSVRNLCAEGIVAGIALAAPLLAMAIWQWNSTHEFGVVKVVKLEHEGYFRWLRTWLYDPQRFPTYAWQLNSPDQWETIQRDGFPDWAFDSKAEREEVAALVGMIRVEGYSSEVDKNFGRLARHRAGKHPLRNFLGLPVLRMSNFWINEDGLWEWLRSSHIHGREPFRSLTAAMFYVLKGSVFVLGPIGFYHCFRLLRTSRDSSSIPFPAICWWLGLVSGCAVVTRTLLLGFLGLFIHGGLCESRYILLAYPMLLYLSALGAIHLKPSVPLPLLDPAELCAR